MLYDHLQAGPKNVHHMQASLPAHMNERLAWSVRSRNEACISHGDPLSGLGSMWLVRCWRPHHSAIVLRQTRDRGSNDWVPLLRVERAAKRRPQPTPKYIIYIAIVRQTLTACDARDISALLTYDRAVNS